jgi:outer membrane immunogenic protein
MRRFVLLFVLVALASEAAAADYNIPVLRGSSPDVPSPYVPAPPVYTGWAGLYAGGQAGYGFARLQLSRFPALFPPDPLVAPLAHLLSGPVFQQVNPQAAIYGAFIGYNCQWDDLVFGLELDYNHSGLVGSSTLTQSFPDTTLGDGNKYYGTIVATASAKVTDYGILRGRAGWAYANFLGYGTLGFAAGQVEAGRVTTITGTPSSGSAGTAFVDTESNTISRITWGYSAGLGVEVLVAPQVFFRGEYEFVQFIAASTIRSNISTLRGGLGIRF